VGLITVILYTAVIVARPAEVIPGWVGFPFAQIASAIALLVVIGTHLVKPRKIVELPHDHFVLLYWAAVAVSELATGWMGGALQDAITFGKLVFFYFLVRYFVRTTKDVNRFAVAFVVIHAIMAVNVIHTTLANSPDAPTAESPSGPPGPDGAVAHALDEAPPPPPGATGDAAQPPELDEEGLQKAVAASFVPDTYGPRLRGSGVFGDPNDLALSLLTVIPILLTEIAGRRTGVLRRALGVALVAPLLFAMYLTRSRGGALALLAAGSTWCVRRFGPRVGAVVTVLAAAVAVAALPERVSDFDTTDESSQGRIGFWHQGIQMLKMHPFTGVGFGHFADIEETHHVAHNSFVNTFAELGLFGAFAWVGMVYWCVKTLLRPRKGAPDPVAEADPAFAARRDDFFASAVGLLVGTSFLSRQYSYVVYGVFALAACWQRARMELLDEPAPRTTERDVRRIVAITVAWIVGIHVWVMLYGLHL
jgi:hypothetical protein